VRFLYKENPAFDAGMVFYIPMKLHSENIIKVSGYLEKQLYLIKNEKVIPKNTGISKPKIL